MEWREASNDQIDQALDHFAGLSAAGLARVCDLINEVDLRQSWMADGARNLTDWVAAKLRLRHTSAAQLVRISRRLPDLPLLKNRFAAGDLSLDQVDAVSRMATPETEAVVIEAALSLSTAALDRAARRNRGISEAEARSVWERRQLIRQWNLDESELEFRGRLPGAEGRILDRAIDSRVDEMGPDPESGLFDRLETRSADALVDIAATTGDPPPRPRSASSPTWKHSPVATRERPTWTTPRPSPTAPHNDSLATQRSRPSSRTVTR